MRRLLTISGLAAASAGFLVASATASTPLPAGSFYGQLSGPFRAIASPQCPVKPPSGATESSCGQITGPFTVTQSGGKKLTGTFVGTLATGPTDSGGTGECNLTNESFTFTVGKGNTFKAVPPAVSSGPNRACLVVVGPNAGQHTPVVLTTVFSLQITTTTGRFKGLTGTISEDGAILPNVGPTGLNQANGRASGNLAMFLGDH